MALIIQDRTFPEIAETEGTSKVGVQDVIELAMLAPVILDATANGLQPAGLISDHLIKSGLPAFWSEQREILGKT